MKIEDIGAISEEVGKIKDRLDEILVTLNDLHNLEMNRPGGMPGKSISVISCPVNSERTPFGGTEYQLHCKGDHLATFRTFGGEHCENLICVPSDHRYHPFALLWIDEQTECFQDMKKFAMESISARLHRKF